MNLGFVIAKNFFLVLSRDSGSIISRVIFVIFLVWACVNLLSLEEVHVRSGCVSKLLAMKGLYHQELSELVSCGCVKGLLNLPNW